MKKFPLQKEKIIIVSEKEKTSMIKKHLLCFLFVFNISNVSPQIVKLEAISVPLSISTPYRISCDQFEKRFQEKKKVKVESLCEIKQIRKLFSKFKPTKAIKGIDVRGKIFVDYSKKQRQEICFDQFGHFVIKGDFFENKDLLLFLLDNKIIEENINHN